ncbi:DUF397 domain-containing protein [Streptomyces sp. NPDC091215]|uniref:DUF397 domain-containing protein n=1 Tax=Streptomyces sp. NPDC091215 TaxID=3155192 RepID=UPI003440430C
MTRLGTTNCFTDLAPEGAWFKSSYSSQDGGNCVEVVALAAGVGVRDSKDQAGPALLISGSVFTAFIRNITG